MQIKKSFYLGEEIQLHYILCAKTSAFLTVSRVKVFRSFILCIYSLGYGWFDTDSVEALCDLSYASVSHDKECSDDDHEESSEIESRNESVESKKEGTSNHDSLEEKIGKAIIDVLLKETRKRIVSIQLRQKDFENWSATCK